MWFDPAANANNHLLDDLQIHADKVFKVDIPFLPGVVQPALESQWMTPAACIFPSS